MEKPTISVVIPVFNAEETISRCLRSVQAQEIHDLEILCVDDGSTDRSTTIIEQMAAEDPRIQLIRQKNRSAGAARNNGMAHARGIYLHFLDADDTVCPGIYQRAADSLERTGAQVCVFQYRVRDRETGEEKLVPCLLNGRERVTSFRREPALFMYNTVAPWNKLYRRSWVKENGLRFDEIPCGNDRGFYFRWLAAARSVSLLMDYGICYQVKNCAALTGNNRWRQLDSLFFAWRSAEQAIADQPPAVRAMLMDCSMTDLLGVVRSAPEEKQSAVLGQLQEFLKEVDFSPMAALPFPYPWRQVCEQLRDDGTDSLTDRKCLINRVRHIVAGLRIWGLRGCVVKRNCK